jgi:hypothetical protein
MLRAMLTWLAALDRAESERTTLEALEAGRQDGIAKFAARRAAELGAEVPALTGGAAAVEDVPAAEPERPGGRKRKA